MFRILTDIFLCSNDPAVHGCVLANIFSILSLHPSNYLLSLDQNLLSRILQKLENIDDSMKSKCFDLLVYIITQFRIIPFSVFH